MSRWFRLYYGPEFIGQLLSQSFAQLEISPLLIEPGSPWENG
jgi:hypothetical protein